MKKEIINKVLRLLSEAYPQPKSMLFFKTPFELLIATILSAQCTDVRVNQVTKKLFERYNTPEKMLSLSKSELYSIIQSCGLANTKSINILLTCDVLLKKYNGHVPNTMEQLITLPGVGRKTANVVLSNAFGIPAIAVDTHVFRVSNRLGLAKGKNVIETENGLMENIPKERWSQAHHWLIYHGRQICKARKPLCTSCLLTDYCEYYNHEVKKL
ncbi:MAG: endonuclease III [Eubacteriales bacterium]